MKIKNGIAISSKITIGKAFVLNERKLSNIPRYTKKDKQSVINEKKRYQHALKQAINELKKIETQTAEMSDISAIFYGYRLILEDTRQEILHKIEKYYFKAEYAVFEWMQNYHEKLSQLKEEFYSRRLIDFKDIEERLIKHLSPQKNHSFSSLEKETIIVAKELMPSQVAILPSHKVTGIVMQAASRTSHSVIVARTKGINLIIGVPINNKISTGDTLILDGFSGNVIVKPTKKILEKYQHLQREHKKQCRSLNKIKTLPSQTLDAHQINLHINIENPSEAKMLHLVGATGVGLYRTEFIYAKNKQPTEETHYQAYKQAIRYSKKSPLIIRTLDIGGDKNFGLFKMREDNPFLGCRSIRLCFRHQNLFKKQLRAILRASIQGNASIMFPMISSLEDLLKAKSILEEVKKELSSENIIFQENIPIGVMIEVPSAALTCDLMADEVDFFCIGTNDLTQYMLAVDRCNKNVSSFYKSAHPAIFRIISHVIDVGVKKNTKVSICGEISKEMMLVFIGMGLKDFSFPPNLVLEMKRLIRNITFEQAKKITKKVLKLTTNEENMKYLRQKLKQIEK